MITPSFYLSAVILWVVLVLHNTRAFEIPVIRTSRAKQQHLQQHHEVTRWTKPHNDVLLHRRNCNPTCLSPHLLNTRIRTTLDSHSHPNNNHQESRHHQRINHNTDAPVSPLIMEVDVRYSTKTVLRYDPVTERYRSEDGLDHNKGDNDNYIRSTKRKTNIIYSRRLKKYLTNAFLPEGVTPSYYNFIRWRILQRFINANVHVFGTQSLLLSLGMNRNSVKSTASVIGLSAALNWVLKDALGKIVRMCWASKMGRKFDPDAKRWRYRSSLLFAIGNGLEVLTFIYPLWFLILATCANACKQMSMLTSSATRNALYNSFRDGSRENIGDITAKGEAQIAIVDLLGIMSGVCLSRTIGISVKSVLAVWITLQVLEVTCVYKSIRAVVFKMLNFERLWQITENFLNDPRTTNLSSSSTLSPSKSSSSYNIIPTPEKLAEKEKIFLPPHHLGRRGISFGSLGRTKLSPDEMLDLMKIFRRERYILVIGKDVKNDGRRWQKRWDRLRGRDVISYIEAGQKRKRSRSFYDHIEEQLTMEAQENCHIVLHEDAQNLDIVKAVLSLGKLRQKLVQIVPSADEMFSMSNNDLRETIEQIRMRRSGDCLDYIEEAKSQSDECFAPFLKGLSIRGWAAPSRFMFGRVSMRAYWPIQKNISNVSTTVSRAVKSDIQSSSPTQGKSIQ